MKLGRRRVRGAAEVGLQSLGCSARPSRARNALGALIILGFRSGSRYATSEDVLQDALGEQVVSKLTVPRICQYTRERYATRCGARRAHDRVYCYLDAILPQTAPRRRARRGRRGRVGPEAGKPESPARAPPRLEREL
jgi:hypothetical protein